jgi:hypothetical protein
MRRTVKFGAWGVILGYGAGLLLSLSADDPGNKLAFFAMHVTPFLLTLMALGAAIGVVFSLQEGTVNSTKPKVDSTKTQVPAHWQENKSPTSNSEMFGHTFPPEKR